MRLSFGITLLLGLLSAVGPISTDIYLPAFSLIDHEFGRVGAAQFTLAAWFVGLAIGQMLQGTLSDRLGRRVPLLYGTVIYAVASAGCAMAPGLASFSTLRLVAAISGSASMVIPRALIRDVAEGFAAARLMSRLVLVLGVVPVLAPAVGGLMMTVVSWRALFWFAAGYGLVCAVLVWRFLPDTLPPERRLRQSAGQIAVRVVQIARERMFITNTMMSAFTFAGIFAYIGGSASVYTRFFHLTPAQYGMLFGVNATGFVAASQVSARLATRFGIDRVLRGGAAVFMVSFGLAAVDAWAGVGGLAGLALPTFAGQSMVGLMGPLTTVNALTRHRSHAGSASALLGTIQFSMGAVAGVLVGLTATGTPRPMTALMVGFGAAAFMMDRLRPRSPDRM